MDDLHKLIEMFIYRSLEKLNVDPKEKQKLGVGRVKIVEIIRVIIKENILNTRQIVASKANFFPLLYKLMQNYERNNSLHNEITKIIEMALVENENSVMNISLLKDNSLFNFIAKELEEDRRIKNK